MVKEKKFLSLKFATGPFEISPRTRSTLGIATHVTPVYPGDCRFCPALDKSSRDTWSAGTEAVIGQLRHASKKEQEDYMSR
jgi:hypothetical protein